MSHFYELDLGAEPDSLSHGAPRMKLVRRSYWLDMNDRSLVMVMTNKSTITSKGLKQKLRTSKISNRTAQAARDDSAGFKSRQPGMRAPRFLSILVIKVKDPNPTELRSRAQPRLN